MADDEAEQAYEQAAPIKAQEIAKNKNSMYQAVVHLNQQTERGKHDPVAGVMDG